MLPFTLSEGPASDDPERYHEDKQHRSWTDGHQCFQHESEMGKLLLNIQNVAIH